jgi:hypothetical protein
MAIIISPIFTNSFHTWAFWHLVEVVGWTLWPKILPKLGSASARRIPFYHLRSWLDPSIQNKSSCAIYLKARFLSLRLSSLFVGKAYPRFQVLHLGRLHITCKQYIKMVRPAMDKCSSLFGPFASYKEKMFCEYGSRIVYCVSRIYPQTFRNLVIWLSCNL